jgi:hypothetical protein
MGQPNIFELILQVSANVRVSVSIKAETISRNALWDRPESLLVVESFHYMRIWTARNEKPERICQEWYCSRKNLQQITLRIWILTLVETINDNEERADRGRIGLAMKYQRLRK